MFRSCIVDIVYSAYSVFPQGDSSGYLSCCFLVRFRIRCVNVIGLFGWYIAHAIMMTVRIRILLLLQCERKHTWDSMWWVSQCMEGSSKVQLLLVEGGMSFPHSIRDSWQPVSSRLLNCTVARCYNRVVARCHLKSMTDCTGGEPVVVKIAHHVCKTEYGRSPSADHEFRR